MTVIILKNDSTTQVLENVIEITEIYQGIEFKDADGTIDIDGTIIKLEVFP